MLAGKFPLSAITCDIGKKGLSFYHFYIGIAALLQNEMGVVRFVQINSNSEDCPQSINL